MTCRDSQNLIVDYAHGELEPAQDASMFEHLQSCVDCRAHWQAELALRDAIRQAYSEEREMPMSVVAGVRQAMHGQRAPSFLESVLTVLRPVYVAPVAAVLLIVGVALRYGALHQTPPELSSTYFVRQHIAQTLGSPSSERTWSAYLLTSENAKSANSSAP